MTPDQMEPAANEIPYPYTVYTLLADGRYQVTRHMDKTGAEREIRWQREAYGREAAIGDVFPLQ